MFRNQFILRVIVIAFMIGVGYALAKAFYHGSFMGIVLGGISLLAGIYFLHVLVTARREMETSQNAGFKQE